MLSPDQREALAIFDTQMVNLRRKGKGAGRVQDAYLRQKAAILEVTLTAADLAE